MEFKGTKGKWKVKTNVHPATDGSSWGWVGTDNASPHDKIDGVNIYWSERKKSEANAKLIAAAPDLLEALQRLVDFSLVKTITNTDEEYLNAKKAIEKALK